MYIFKSSLKIDQIKCYNFGVSSQDSSIFVNVYSFSGSNSFEDKNKNIYIYI